MSEKKKDFRVIYVATKGITFEGLKGKPRVEAGQPIPDGVDPKTIKDLLANGDIKEAK